MNRWPKFFAFPAIAIGVLLAIVFFKIYGPMTRPEVPAPVASTVDYFAPGVKIGNTVEADSRLLRHLTYVQNVGFIGTPAGNTPIKQVRLLLDRTERGKGVGDRNARVDAVEMLSVRGEFRGSLMSRLAMVFRGNPKFGCITPVSDSMPYREVLYWPTKHDRGGVALINDWATAARPSRGKELGVWSMIAWAGPFEGSNTLRAYFQPRSCADIAGR